MAGAGVGASHTLLLGQRWLFQRQEVGKQRSCPGGRDDDATLRREGLGYWHRGLAGGSPIENSEQPGKGGHDRLWHHRARLEQVHVLPIRTRLADADIGQVRAGSFGAEQLRSLIGEIAWRGRSSENCVRGQWADLPGVAVRATLGDVDLSPGLLLGRQRRQTWAGQGVR